MAGDAWRARDQAAGRRPRAPGWDFRGLADPDVWDSELAGNMPTERRIKHM